MKSNTKLILAKEYLFLLKIICLIGFLYLLANGSIWIINNNRQSKVHKREMLLAKIDSVQNSIGSITYFEKVQQELYSIINTPEYYTKQFAEFKKQFTPDSSRIKLYKGMVNEKQFVGTYEYFNTKYFPTIDNAITQNIASIRTQIDELNRNNLEDINYIKWQIPLLCLLFMYVLRLFLISLKKAKSTIRNQNGL